MSVDAHCHVDLHADPRRIVESAISAGLKMVAVTTTPAAFTVSCTFTDKTKGVWPALGMHPEVVGSRPRDASLFSKYLDQVQWVGEIGLDGSSRFRGFWDMQISVFERILRQCSDAGGRVMSIHSRGAASKVIALLTDYPDAGIPVLHWFSGPLADVDTALKLGAYFSVNCQMLQSRAGQLVAQRIPLDRLLTESDAPFALSGHAEINDQIIACEHRLAEIVDCDMRRLRRAVCENFERIVESKQ